MTHVIGTDKFLGATERELLNTPESTRLVGYIDQRQLFPHAGTMRLEEGALVLEGWREIARSDITSVELTFTDAYRRRQAAGFRGRQTSLGLLGDLGKPLVLTIRGEDRVYLLIGFRWFLGTSRARNWAPTLRRWTEGTLNP